MNGAISLYKKTKLKLTDIIPGFLTALLIAQPLLDIVSHWANEWDFTAVTTVARFFMLVLVVLYGFIISDKKKAYIIAAAVMGGYWILHIIACLGAEGGYAQPISDANHYLRAIQLPLFTFVFITMFRKCDKVPEYVQKAYCINMVIMLHSLILSYMTGTQIYTYAAAEKGLMSWASVHNSQSAIVVFLVPLMFLYAYNKKNKILYYVVTVGTLVNMFFVGTKVNYFSIFIIVLAMMILLIISGEKNLYYYVVIFLVAVVCALCYRNSVAFDIKATYAQSMSDKQDFITGTVEHLNIKDDDADETTGVADDTTAAIQPNDTTGTDETTSKDTEDTTILNDTTDTADTEDTADTKDTADTQGTTAPIEETDVIVPDTTQPDDPEETTTAETTGKKPETNKPDTNKPGTNKPSQSEDDSDDLPNHISWDIFMKLDYKAQLEVRKIYQTYLGPVVQRFGFPRVFKTYNYSLVASELSAQRPMKTNFAQMAFDDATFMEKLFGYEYCRLLEEYTYTNYKGETITKVFIYDLENDFPSIYYYSGYVGTAIYALFVLYFFGLMMVSLITRFKKTVNMENGFLALSYVLILGTAQFSGNVLRRPNVSIYFSVILAYIYYVTVIRENVRYRDLFTFWKKDKKTN